MKIISLIIPTLLLTSADTGVSQGTTIPVLETKNGGAIEEDGSTPRDLLSFGSRSKRRFFSSTSSKSSSSTSSKSSSSTSSKSSSSTSSESSSGSDDCENIVDIVCSDNNFELLCVAVQEADLVDALFTHDLTVFAPTNKAFENLGDATLGAVLSDIPILQNILLFHVVTDVVPLRHLECSERIEMANGKETRTICSSDTFFQKGAGNPRSSAPQIISADIKTCQGVVHVIDQVLLPANIGIPEEISEESNDSGESSCSSIADIVCRNSRLSTLCSAVQVAGLEDALNGNDQLTIFAPNNAAFAALGGDTLNAVLADVDTLTRILLLHVVPGRVLADDLECSETIETLQGQSTRTVCSNDSIFQKGSGNVRSNLPEIISTDIQACNGVIHILDGVLLPGDHE